MQREATQHHRPLPTAQAAHEQCLRAGIAAPDLATVKDFIRFYVATSSPKIADVPTVDSINTVAEWFFAGFNRVTGTDTDEEERSEVYNVSGSPGLGRTVLLTWVVGTKGLDSRRPGGEQTPSET